MVNVITYSSAKARMRGPASERDWVDLTRPENACSDRTRPSFSGPFLLPISHCTNSRARPSTEHQEDADHQRTSLHQRHQAPRQPGRIALAGRHSCPLQAPNWRRCAVHLRNRRAWDAGGACSCRSRSPHRRLLRSTARMRPDIYRQLGISFDHFGRSSSPQNRALTQHFFKSLDDRGFIRGAHAEPGLFARRRAFPSGPLHRRHLSALPSPTAPAATNARTARGCWSRPT